MLKLRDILLRSVILWWFPGHEQCVPVLFRLHHY